MADTPTATASQGPARANVENTDDINLRKVVISALVLLVIVLLSFLAMYVLFGYFRAEQAEDKKSPYPLGAAARKLPLQERLPDDSRFKDIEQRMPHYGQPLPWSMPKPPRLEGLDTPLNLNQPLNSGVKGWPSLAPQQKETEDKQLATPTWVNKEEGTVLLPIELVLKRLDTKLPARSSSADPKQERYYQTPSSANSGQGPVGGKQ